MFTGSGLQVRVTLSDKPMAPSFDRIFSEMLFGFTEKRRDTSGGYICGSNYTLPGMQHANLRGFAEGFFDKLVPDGTDPVDFYTSLLSRAPHSQKLLPLTAHGIPVGMAAGEMQGDADQKEHFEWSRRNPIRITQEKSGWSRTLSMDPLDYKRAFGQLLPAVLNLSSARGFDKPLVVDSFDGLRDYFPEGLEKGILVINGPVRDYCGKHSEGGTIIVNGPAGACFGDTADNTDFYAKGQIGSVWARGGSTVYACGGIADRSNFEHLKCKVVEGDQAVRAYEKITQRLDAK